MSASHKAGVAVEDRFDQAAVWHALWRHVPIGGLPPEQLQRWTEWARNPDNKSAYDAVESAARLRHQLVPPAYPSAVELAADESSDVVPMSRSIPRPAVKRWLRPTFFATAAAAVGFWVLPQWLHPAAPPHPAAQRIWTGEGEKKQVTLRDGSQVWLGDATELSVRFGPCMRTIVLQSGEALFNVAHNRACPFVVLAGDGAIRAVGTQFSVRRTLDRVTVTVAEGIVNVQPRDSFAAVAEPEKRDLVPVTWTEARLVRGQEVTFAGPQQRGPVESEDPHVATGWLDGHREYRHEPLKYVVADINRSFEKQIQVQNSSIGDLQFTGRIYESQVNDWLRALETIFPVKISETDSGHILIQSRLP
jgi:transmembrane sensor